MKYSIKNILIGIISISFNSCHYSSDQPDSITINKEIANRLFGQNKAIVILSCIKCQCFIEAVNSLHKKNRKEFDDFLFLTDTTCSKLGFQSGYISQKTLDSLSNDLFNVVLIKRNNSNFKVEIVETGQSNQLLSIIKKFFKE